MSHERPAPPEPDVPNTGRVHAFPEQVVIDPAQVVVKPAETVVVQAPLPRGFDWRSLVTGGSLVFVVMTLVEKAF